MKKLSIALLCALLLGCQGTEIPIPPIGGQTGTGEKETGTPETIENPGNTAVTGEEDPDTAWMREFTEKFLASLNEPCTHLSGSDDDCSAFFIGDMKTLQKEWKAWEAQGMNSYTVSFQNTTMVSTGLKHYIVLNEKRFSSNNSEDRKEAQTNVYEEALAHIATEWGKIEESPYYEFMWNGCPKGFPLETSSSLVTIPMMTRLYDYLYTTFIGLAAPTLHAEGDTPEPVWVIRDPKTWDHHNIKVKEGLNVEYHPQYHYPTRIHWISWQDWSDTDRNYLVENGLNKPVVKHGFVKISLEPLTTPAE
jgi:hypothetical protein